MWKAIKITEFEQICENMKNTIDKIFTLYYNHKRGEGMKALINDNDLHRIEQIGTEVLKYGNFKIGFSLKKSDCIEIFSQNNPELIILSADGTHKEIIEYIRRSGKEPVIFLTGSDEQQALEVYKNKCDGFILLDKLSEDAALCMKRFEQLSKRFCRISVVTFGRFDVFVGGKAVDFKNSKAKELLAICVDRMGGEVSMDEAIDKLWPTRDYDERVKRLYRKAVIRLNSLFSEYGEKQFFVSRRGSCCILKDRIDCDYFRFLSDTQKYGLEFKGEYMFNYSWAEQTLARLNKIAAKYGILNDADIQF